MEEVRHLESMGCTRDMISMQGLGYKEILDAYAGKCTVDEAFEKIKLETRHFAKRQFTWFRRERAVTWIHKEDYEDEEAILRVCAGQIQDRFDIKQT